jgi:hypothetical protein
MRIKTVSLAIVAGLGFVLGPFSRSSAQTEVGSVAGTVGTLEVQRGDEKTWQPIFVGAPVLLSDHVRTGEESGARLVLRDDTVIDLGSGAHIKVERFATDADPQRQRALIRLFEGRIRVLLGGRDSASRGRFEVETATAIAGGRTAAFVIRYDAQSKLTDVVGIEGTTEVQGVLGVLEAPAEIGAGQWTRVAKGRLPAPPETLGDQQLAAYASGLDIVGTGSRESLDVGHSALAGKLLRPEDRPGAAPAPGAAPVSTASYLAPRMPGETFVQRRSKDLSVVTQPIPEFRGADPDLPRSR